jgi:predicted membrane channel-forming protein YqfA (hemolysin III family)
MVEGMSLAFLHGGEAVVILLVVAALAACAAFALAVWWWRHPPRSPITHAAVYLLVAAVCLLLWMVEPSSMLLSWLGIAASLPWSILYFILGGLFFGDEKPVWPLLAGVAVNAALIYEAAKLVGRRGSGGSRRTG